MTTMEAAQGQALLRTMDVAARLGVALPVLTEPRDGDLANPLSPYRLTPSELTLAIAHALLDRMPSGEIKRKLWREDPDEVDQIIDRIVTGRASFRQQSIYDSRGLLAEKMRRLRRPAKVRKQTGFTLAEMATSLGVSRATMVALLEHHGYVETAPFGGRQSRVLVSDQTFDTGLGHNVPAKAVDGSDAPFPVFYPGAVEGVLWTLDWDRITARAAAIGDPKERLSWLLAHHDYLPITTLATLSGCTRHTVAAMGKPKRRTLSAKQEKALALVDEALAVGLPYFPENMIREETNTDRRNWGKLVADTPVYQEELQQRGIVRKIVKGRPAILTLADPGPDAAIPPLSE